MASQFDLRLVFRGWPASQFDLRLVFRGWPFCVTSGSCSGDGLFLRDLRLVFRGWPFLSDLRLVFRGWPFLQVAENNAGLRNYIFLGGGAIQTLISFTSLTCVCMCVDASLSYLILFIID